MTYNKPTNSIEVKTRGGSTFTATDTASDPIASDALRDFLGAETMHIRGEGMTLVPFRATDVVTVTKSVTSVGREDPYGCEEESSNKVCSAKVCSAKVGC